MRSFLLSSAHSWLDRYHVDGIRVDAVASMLYLDYSREDGEWVPNEHGGNENLGALRFLKKLNETVYGDFPDVQMIAEESTAWPMVSRPTDMGGLGFGLKWDMGWMHDTLDYFEKDPVHRRYAQDELTFRMVYAFTENFALPLSHDEVVHGKGSLLAKMPGDRWQKFANLRALYGYQYGQPGKKLLFMGADMASETEWNHDRELPWWLLGQPDHEGVRRWVETLNRLHRSEPALHEVDFHGDGFEWVDASDTAHSVLSFLRQAEARRRRPAGSPPAPVRCWWSATSPRCRGRTTRSGCRWADDGSSWPTATPRPTAAAVGGTWGAVDRRRTWCPWSTVRATAHPPAPGRQSSSPRRADVAAAGRWAVRLHLRQLLRFDDDLG